MNRLTVGLMATFVAILLASGLLAYVLRDRSADTSAGTQSESPLNPPNAAATPSTGTEKQGKRSTHPLLWELFGPDSSGLSPTTYASWAKKYSWPTERISIASNGTRKKAVLTFIVRGVPGRKRKGHPDVRAAFVERSGKPFKVCSAF